MPGAEMSTPATADESDARRALQLRFAGTGAPQTARRAAPPSPILEAEAGPAEKRPTKVVSGALHPLHVEFDQIARTPTGHSVWRISYGTQYSGGLDGRTEDIEFQVLDPGGNGTIDSAGSFTGSLEGRDGGFVYESEGVQHADGSFTMKFVIAPGTAHGELKGLSGRFIVVATRDHCKPDDTPETCETLVSYTLAYHLPKRKN